MFFFSVDMCYISWSVLLHHLICIRHCWRLIAPLELYCASASQYYLSFKLSGKVVFFHLFCHLYFYFFASAAFILDLHRCSKGQSISRVQKENCYYFRNGFCFSLWVYCRVGYCHACCTIGVVLRHCCWILFEFQVIRKGCIFTRPRIANRRRLGTSQPLELYCTIGDYFSRYDLSFKWSGKVVKDLAMIRDLMRRVCVTVTEIQTWNVAKLFQENVVWLET